MTATECGTGWALRCASSSSRRCRCRCGGRNHGTAPALELEPRNRSIAELVRSTPGAIVLRDVGHDRGHKSMTNDAAEVVADWLERLNGRRLFYFDSMGMLTELRVSNGRFAGFAPVSESDTRELLVNLELVEQPQ